MSIKVNGVRYIRAAHAAEPSEGAVRVQIKKRTEPRFVRPKFVYEISAPTMHGGTVDDGVYDLVPVPPE